ncbi:site-specific integrase [Micrococcus luteus]|uniref:site-specific integrase n=1 Tax=Micrococcus luteus TaxID=1270 RepID=UPI00380F2DE3
MASLTSRQAPSRSTITPASRVRDVTGVYLREVEGRGRAPRTVQRYRETVENHVLKARGGVGDLRLSECTTGRLETFLQGIARDHGAASAKLARTVLKGVLDVAARHDAITRNPLASTSPIQVERKEVRALSLEDVRTLRRRLRAWQDAPMPDGRHSRSGDLLDVVDVMLATGCRIGEALALRWEDVDLDARRVAITGTVVSLKGRGMVRQDHAKSRGSMKSFPVDEHTAEMVRGRWERMAGLGIIGPMVFPSATGTLWDPSSFRAQWRPAAVAIGFEWVTPHTFRKTVATRVADAEGLAAASAYLGHSSEAVTAGHYVERAREAADMTAALAGFFEEESLGR